jgi:hypothetical protein
LNDLSVTNGEIEVAAAERTQSDLIGPDGVKIERATKCRAGGRAAEFLTGVEQVEHLPVALGFEQGEE